MSFAAVVPQKRLREAKTRLAAVLSAGERAALSLALLDRVCAAVRAAPGVESLSIVSPDPAVRAWGEAHGRVVTPDPGCGLNAALDTALRGPACAGRDVLIVAADLPWLCAADVAALAAVARAGCAVIAPSKDGAGTSALAVPRDCRFATAFGPGSRAAHRRAAEAAGLIVVEVHRPGFAFDLDTPADLAAVARAGWARQVRRAAPGARRYSQG